MTFRPSHAAAKDPANSNEDQSSTARSVRGQQSVWGLPAPRRGLTPLSTTLSPPLESGQAKTSSSSSPFGASFSSVLNPSIHDEGTRGAHSSHISRTSFSLLQTGSQQVPPGQALLSPRSRAITPSSTVQSTTPTASSGSGTQTGAGGGSGSGGGGGGGAASRNLTFSPPLTSPTGNNFERSPFSNPPSATSSQSSVSKITTTQIFLLLNSITEKEGKAKWETQAENIRKLAYSNGMESFGKFFRRLVQGNAPQIFPGISRNVENPGNYPLLVQEMSKITQDPGQAQRIAESLDVPDGDVFRDFALSTFMNHFNLNSYAKTLLASALTRTKQQDLRNKAGSILANNFDDLLADLANPRPEEVDASPSLLATCVLKYYQDVPEHLKSKDDIHRLHYSFGLRYKKQKIEMPPEILSALVLLDLLEADNFLVNAICHHGPQITITAENASSFLGQLPLGNLDERQVSRGLLFMILTPDWQDYDIPVMISSLRKVPELRKLRWQEVMRGFDYKDAEITKEKFLSLYNSFLPLVKEEQELDIQALWGGEWANYKTQLSYLRAFLGCTPDELDVQSIPRLRQTFNPLDSADGPHGSKIEAEKASRDTMISQDAVVAVVQLLIPANEAPSELNTIYLMDMLTDKAGLFLCSLASIPHQRTAGQENLMKRLFRGFLTSSIEQSSYVLHTLWVQDKNWVAMSLMGAHMEDPLDLVPILDVSREMEWLEDLLTLTNGFGIDLAALALRKGYVTLEQWLKEKPLSGPSGVITAISKFLVLKAQDELRTSHDEQPRPRTVSLSMKTVHGMLVLMDEHMTDRNELKVIQRQCLQAYPRLIIFCEGMTDNVDVECTESNNLPRIADAEMQDLYKRMYNGELTVQNILEYLQECKASEDPQKVDLFACMIHGLFDEFSCFSEYPLGPLATTAVLFGGIMQVRLISDITLRVGQDMVLDSVRDYGPDEKMYKFGLQALLHVIERFQEPEWEEYCQKLVKIPGLRNTAAFNAATQVFNRGGGNEDFQGVNGLDDDAGLLDGGEEDPLASDSHARFRSVNVETVAPAEEPDENTQEKVVFFFNNVTEQNLSNKIGQIEAALGDGYHHWFAHSLVESRAKLEPNNQPLYMAILDLLSSRVLWAEVLRETLFSVQKLLNAETTMQSATDRKFLKNLAVWLGSLTLARNKPIRQKDIAFLDLLVEGYSMQKLILVIPFTCNVLAQGAKSRVFRPPNPWLMEVLAALMELYKEAEIKLNLKFEIEVLLKEFGLQVDSVPPSMNYRVRRVQEEEVAGPLLSDGMENFDDLSMAAINRGARSSRFDVDSISSSLPDLASILNFPPPTGSVANQARLRQIVLEAVRRAIIEIVAPVVERSVTIATIATIALIHKDFGTEGDEDRLRRAAQQMARQLSGSLALVTCKEPLKMSMTNYIRLAQNELPEQTVPEGAILMCVNDNLDLACNIVEQQAEERSMPEIEAHIENELGVRRRHLAEHPNEPFVNESYSRWSGFIPDPYKQTPGGLNQEQMAIYLDFARQSRGAANHAQTSSADSGRQLPDVLQDAFSTMPNVHSGADTMVMSHQTPQQPQHHLAGRLLPPPLPNPTRQVQTNGYVDIAVYDERVQELMGETRRVIQEGGNGSPADQQRQEAVFDLLNQIWEIIERAPESVAMNCAETICKVLYGEPMTRQEVEILARLLSKLYETYPAIRTEVTEWARGQDDERLVTADVTVPLVRHEILQLRVLDNALTRLVQQRGEAIIEYITDLLSALVLTKRPVALRSELANTMGAIGVFITENQGSALARNLVDQLRDWGMEGMDKVSPAESGPVKEHLHKYIFVEWVCSCEALTGPYLERHCAAFISQLTAKEIIGTKEQTAEFLRICTDQVIERMDIYETLAAKDDLERDFFEVDCLAKFIVMLTRSQADVNGTIKGQGSRVAYMGSLLSVLIMVMNVHMTQRGDRFNQRSFFRLWSSIFNEWSSYGKEDSMEDTDMLLCFADNLVTIGPFQFPKFTFSWLALISHRAFMPNLLRSNREQASAYFTNILATLFTYLTALGTPTAIPNLPGDLYRSILRIVLILHHDFPEFLIENHFRLCNAVPTHCVQVFNIVLSAYPSSLPELPSPFVTGLKIDRLEEMRRPPEVSSAYLDILRSKGVIDIIDGSMKTSKVSADGMHRLKEATRSQNPDARNVDRACIHALVLYIGQSAMSLPGLPSSSPFSPDAPATAVFSQLAEEFPIQARVYLVDGMVNQLRYPNSHTHYFSSLLLHLFKTSDQSEINGTDTASVISKTLIERGLTVKPHPWGLVTTLLELLKNPDYPFWGQEFVKDLANLGALFGKPLIKNYWE